MGRAREDWSMAYGGSESGWDEVRSQSEILNLLGPLTFVIGQSDDGSMGIRRDGIF